MRNDKGMSLAEIILVIAILAIFAGGAIGGMSYIRYGNAKTCASEINAALDRVRLEAMSRAEKPFLYIYQSGDSYYMKVSTEPATEALLDATGTRLGNRQLRLFYETTVSASSIEIGNFASGSYMQLGFEKGTGGISANPADSSYYNKIMVADSDGTPRYTITLVKATGKHFIR